MMNGRIWFASLLVAFTVTASAGIAVAQDAPGSGQQPTPRRTWELTPDNALRPVDAPRGVTQTPENRPAGLDDLNAIDALLAKGRHGQAFDRLVRWFKAYPDSKVRDRALLMAADALIAMDERIKAFYYCDELMDRHADSAYFSAALQKQYDIADAYLSGLKDRWFIFRSLDRSEEALEMLFRIQTRSPGSPVAENAMLRSADYYWANGDWDYAADAYAAYARTYPRSPYVKSARLREAYANLAQVRGPLYDAKPILNARATLTELRASDPELARRENLDQKIELADRFLARKLYLGADYYRRTGKRGAAIHLFNRVIELYPTLPEAEDARRAITSLGGQVSVPAPQPQGR